MTLTNVQVEAIAKAKSWLGYGERGLHQALAILTRAAETMLGQVHCTECGRPVIEAVVDPDPPISHVGIGATYCRLSCLEMANDRRIASGGAA